MFRHATVLRMIAAAATSLLVGWVVYRNWSLISASFNEIAEVPGYIIIVGLGLTACTFVLAASSYYSLAFKRLRAPELGLVELSAAFINRLVPSGFGGLGVHGLYLHKRKHTVAEATTVVSVNNLLGMTVHLGLLALVILIIQPATELDTSLPFTPSWVLITGIVLLGVCVAVRPLRRKLQSFGKNILKSLVTYRKKPQKLTTAALVLGLLTLTNTLILLLVSDAVGMTLSFASVLVIFSIGVLLGAAVPTPGGFGGVEAGLIAGYIAFGEPSEQAIAATLVFRLLTFWAPLIPGGVAFWFAQRRRLLG